MDFIDLVDRIRCSAQRPLNIRVPFFKRLGGLIGLAGNAGERFGIRPTFGDTFLLERRQGDFRLGHLPLMFPLCIKRCLLRTLIEKHSLRIANRLEAALCQHRRQGRVGLRPTRGRSSLVVDQRLVRSAAFVELRDRRSTGIER